MNDTNKKYRPVMHARENNITKLEEKVAELEKKLKYKEDVVDNIHRFTCEKCNKGIIDLGDNFCSHCGVDIDWVE